MEADFATGEGEGVVDDATLRHEFLSALGGGEGFGQVLVSAEEEPG